MHQGHICILMEHMVVHRSVAEKFKQLFQTKINSLYFADPKQDPKTLIGSLITQATGNRVKSLLEDALSKGAGLLGGKFEIKGTITQLIALTNVNESDIYYQKSFGSIVAVYEFDLNEEESIG